MQFNVQLQSLFYHEGNQAQDTKLKTAITVRIHIKNNSTTSATTLKHVGILLWDVYLYICIVSQTGQTCSFFEVWFVVPVIVQGLPE